MTDVRFICPECKSTKVVAQPGGFMSCSACFIDFTPEEVVTGRTGSSASVREASVSRILMPQRG